jgi:hypothetical protein
LNISLIAGSCQKNVFHRVISRLQFLTAFFKYCSFTKLFWFSIIFSCSPLTNQQGKKTAAPNEAAVLYAHSNYIKKYASLLPAFASGSANRGTLKGRRTRNNSNNVWLFTKVSSPVCLLQCHFGISAWCNFLFGTYRHVSKSDKGLQTLWNDHMLL